MLTDADYLARLQDDYAQHRVLPSYARIGSLLKFSSKGSVAELVIRLKEARYLESTKDRRLKPGPRFFERPLAASKLAAGAPGSAVGDLEETVTIDEYLIRRPSQTVLVTVKGDSMIDAGIRPGDVVVVEKRRIAKDGDIVVAIVDNEFTVKRLAREAGRYVLKPENKAYEMLRPKELEIFGVVVGRFRKY